MLDHRAIEHRVRDDPRLLGTSRRRSRAHWLPQRVHRDVRSACSFERCQGLPVADCSRGHERRRLRLVERFSHRVEQPLVSIDVQAIEDEAKAPDSSEKARFRCPSCSCPRRACQLLRKIASDPLVRRVIVAVLRSLLRTLRERRARDILAWSAPVAATLWNTGLLPAPLTGHHD